MTAIESRLKRIHSDLVDLQAQLAQTGEDAAAQRLLELAQDLEAALHGAEEPARRRSRRARVNSEVERCPLCSIRSLHLVENQTRFAKATGRDEALWRCTSCGHELWRETR